MFIKIKYNKGPQNTAPHKFGTTFNAIFGKNKTPTKHADDKKHQRETFPS